MSNDAQVNKKGSTEGRWPVTSVITPMPISTAVNGWKQPTVLHDPETAHGAALGYGSASSSPHPLLFVSSAREHQELWDLLLPMLECPRWNPQHCTTAVFCSIPAVLSGVCHCQAFLQNHRNRNFIYSFSCTLTLLFCYLLHAFQNKDVQVWI